MKKHLKTIGFAAVLSFAAVSGYAADAASGSTFSTDGICELVNKFKDIFKLLRTFAFVGAAFTMATWAWGFISAGKVDKPMDEVKNKGLSLLVSTALLFGVGVILNLLINAVGQGGALSCPDIGSGW